MGKFGFKIKGSWLGKVIGNIVGMFLSAWIAQWIWNWKCGDLFGAIHLEYWDVFLLIWLARIIKGCSDFSLMDYEIEPVKDQAE